ncbi:hypothetical protein GCM10011344_38960 [Dokdonia pacifica]|uniref:Uncharacterized protein n=1 Tax=Dokdonia pacifica TaxID=1627892 RepID=A0A239A0U7_9FLAO|nr:hypothetical protein [Dokdonia pacifica]GGG34382.1 hypothetical protein GCM10011344_38960 [Dokdonia pacifica]SNR89267.1 hypothetical protein SAMN06265376_10475 [Dokdonia pacifica]
MKKSLKELSLNKEVISSLELNKIEGQGTCGCGPGSNEGTLISIPPPGMQCF